jgi:hypothetical protein
MFRSMDAPKCTRDLQIPLDAKTQVRRNMSRLAFCAYRTEPPEHEKWWVDVS